MLRDRFSKEKTRPLLKEIGRITLSYLAMQLILLAINVIVLTVGMLILDMKWWSFPIALAIGIVDILPILGSGIVFLPWIIYNLYIGSYAMALGLFLMYAVMIVLRLILEPAICGKKIGLTPLVTLAAALGGVVAFGGTGLITGPLLVAIVKAVLDSPVYKQTYTPPQAPPQAPPYTPPYTPPQQ